MGTHDALPRNSSQGAAVAAKQVQAEDGEDEGAHVAFLPLEEKDKYQRFVERQQWRKPLYRLPVGEFFELPGRPHVCYTIRNYGDASFGVPGAGAKCARDDFGFMFKAFETGQTPPHRLKKQQGGQHQPTIHEYLDWTVTAAPATEPDDVDFGGFRTVLLYSRDRPEYPPPDTYDEGPLPSVPGLGAVCRPMPRIMPKGTKPMCVATMRCGKDYLEVPFFATSDNHRGKGYGRCLLEAMEQIGQALAIPRFLLCSTDDTKVRNMWAAVGFNMTTEDHYKEWDVRMGDLIYMTNTVQMHKEMPAARPYRPIMLRHGAYQQRLYTPLDAPRGQGLQCLNEAEAAKRKRQRTAPAKAPVKSMAKGKNSHMTGDLAPAGGYSGCGQVGSR